MRRPSLIAMQETLAGLQQDLAEIDGRIFPPPDLLKEAARKSAALLEMVVQDRASRDDIARRLLAYGRPHLPDMLGSMPAELSAIMEEIFNDVEEQP
jgi:hypothetical protein